MRSSRSPRSMKIVAITALFLLTAAIVPQTTNAAGNPIVSVWNFGQYLLSFVGFDEPKNSDRRPPSVFTEPDQLSPEQKGGGDISRRELAAVCPSTGVILNVPSIAYPTIQSAIDAANPSGTFADTIIVAGSATPYTEQLYINKCVTIQGAGRDGATPTVIKAPASLNPIAASGALSLRQAIVSIGSGYVKMTGVRVEGPVEFDLTTYGIFVHGNATLEMRGSHVTAIHKLSGIDGVQNGLAIAAGSNAANTIGGLVLDDMIIDAFQKNGITVDRVDSIATITNTTINGGGETTLIAKNGIQISRGASATISGTTSAPTMIVGHDYGPTSWSSAGILAYQAGNISISGVSLTNNDAAIYNSWRDSPTPALPTVPHPAFTVTNNIIESDNYGIIIDGPSGVIRGNSIHGGDVGLGVWATNATTIDLESNSITNAGVTSIEYGTYSTAVTASPAPVFNAHFNRIAGPAGGVTNDTGWTLAAENNFWGMNTDPTTVTNFFSGTGAVSSEPRLLLSGITGVTPIVEGGTSDISGVTLRRNSAGMLLPATPAVPDGIGVSFSGSGPGFASLTPSSASTAAGDASPSPNTVMTAVAAGIVGNKNAVVSAQVDNAIIQTTVIVQDTTDPTVVLTANGPNPTNSTTITFTAVFSEPVNDFTIAGVSLSGTTAGGATVASVAQIAPNDGTTYSITVTVDGSSSGLVQATVSAGAANDSADPTNSNTASGSAGVGYFVNALELVVDEASVNCLGNGAPVYSNIPAAATAATPGSIIRVCPGTYPFPGTTTVNKAGLTIIGVNDANKPVIEVTGTSDGFDVTATGVTIEDLEIVKIGTGTQHHMIRVQANDFTGRGNFIHGPSWQTPDHVSRAFIFNAGLTGWTVDSNIIENLRQPAYTTGGSGTVSNNAWTGTKGWVNDGSLITFTNNSMTTCPACDTDIALLNNASTTYQTFYADRLALSSANDNAHIDVQFTAADDSGRAASYVNVTGAVTNDGRSASPYSSIQQAIFKTGSGIVDGTLPGGTVYVAAGTYTEDVEVPRSLKIIGVAGASATTVSGPLGGVGPYAATTFRLNASNVDLSGFTITRDGNNSTDWNNPALNSAGVAIQGLTLTGNVIHHNIITGMRTGIDINNSGDHTVRNNVVTNNHTGLIFRNQTDDMTVTENFITNNRTVGVLFLDATNGASNTPLQQALNGAFINNDISGNWYGQIVDRQSSVHIPASNPKNFQGNWLGTSTPVVTTANSAEPPYSLALCPLGYPGCSAVAPGGQPDIAGPASTNIRYNLPLTSSVDTDVETIGGRGTYGFQGKEIFIQSETAAGWFFFNEGATGSGDFAIGPDTPPLGNGSAHLSVDANGRHNIGTLNYGGIRLDAITHLRFSSYQISGNAALTPSLQFDVDNDITNGSADYQGRLVFEPYMTPGNVIQQGQWQTWNPMAGKWWGSSGGGVRPITNACPQSAPCDWSQILSLFPNAGIRAAANNGVLMFRAGGPTGSNFDGYVDAFEISINTANTTHDFEAGRPTVTVNQAWGQSDPTNTSPINFTVVFSTPVTSFDASDVALSGTAGATTAVVTPASGPSATYNVAVTGMSGSGTVIASVNDGAATGTGGASQASTSTDNTVTYDVTVPTVGVVGSANPTNSTAITFTATFSEDVSGFGTPAGDYTLTNATVDSISCTGSPTECAVSVTASSTGPVGFTVNASAATDAAGNGNTASNTATVTYDGIAPTVTVAGVGNPANDTSSPVEFTITFSEDVTGLTASEIVVTGSAFTSSTPTVVLSGGPSIYSVSVSNMNQTGTVIASVATNVAQDSAGNGNANASSDMVNFVAVNTPVTVNPVNTGPAPPATGSITRWWGFDDNTNALMAPSYGQGPGANPALLGDGSARLNTTATGKYLFFSNHFNSAAALPLSQITEIKYDAFAVDPTNAVNLPSLQIGIDFDSTDANAGWQGRLVFEPADNTIGPNQPIVPGTWQKWTATGGRFWLSQPSLGGNPTFCSNSNRCTWSQLLAQYPNINIPNTDFGFLGFRSSGGGVNPVENYIDNLVVGVNSSNTTFDFEPDAPTISISDATAVTEGDSGSTSATFTVSLSGGPSVLDTTVLVSTADGTATVADSDYVQVTNQTVTIPAGSISTTMAVNVNGDNKVETDEAFVVNLSNAVNALIADGQGSTTITNDDVRGTVQFSASGYTVNETAGTASISVTRTGGSDEAISVACSTSNGTAISPADYTETNQTITFADQDTATKTCTVPVVNDTLSESSETVNLSLSSENPTGTLGSQSTAVLTINDSGAFISISGNIQQFVVGGPNTNLGGVTVALSGSASASATTDSNGNYTFNGGLPAGTNNYLVTPSLAGKVFDPTNRSYVNAASNVTGANFVAYDTGAVPRNLRIVNTYQSSISSNVTVPIVLDSMGTENALSFSLNYNPALLTFSSVACGSDNVVVSALTMWAARLESRFLEGKCRSGRPQCLPKEPDR